jgi:alpha-L-fucosidase 2
VQGLWWHYLYSADTEFLKKRAYEPIKAAVEFLVAYMKRPEASGKQVKISDSILIKILLTF